VLTLTCISPARLPGLSATGLNMNQPRRTQSWPDRPGWDADETTARLATDMAISIWRVAAERWLRGDDSPSLPNFSMRRGISGGSWPAIRTGTEGAAADQPARYQE